MVQQEREHEVSREDTMNLLSDNPTNLTDDEFTDMHEDFDMDSFIDGTLPSYEVGQIITGKVLKVSQDDVVVDIGSKSEGLIPLREFLEDGKDPNVFVGMNVDVMIVKREGHDGLPILSRQKAKERMAKKLIRQAFKNGDPVRCVVKSILRGGFQVEVDGLRGFIPFSQMGPGARTPEDQQSLLGQNIEAKILEMRNKRDLILSQRQALEEKREKLRQQTLNSLKEGNWIKGVVKNLTDFGAFVDLGGIDGLLHVNDMTWGHINNPREVVKVGDEVFVMVLGVEGERISLGLKQKTPDPWMNVSEKFPSGSIVGGKVTSMTKYGSFVELEQGVEGLIHISEMSWTKRIRHPSELINEGDEVRVKVLGIDNERKRISLSLRQTTVDPWTLAKINNPPGTVIEGEITGMTDFGAFVRLPEGVDGMIHVSDMSWAEKVTHPKQLLKKGEKIRAKVLDIDPSQQRISLGLKQLEPDPWDLAQEKYRVGKALEVKVVRITEFGAFVELEEGIEGLAHASTLVLEKGKHPGDVVKVGDIITMKIIKFDRANRKISLSLKDFVKEQEEKEVQRYMSSDSGGNATLGELLGGHMSALVQKQAKQMEKKKSRDEVMESPVAEESVTEPAETVAVVEPEPAEETMEPEPTGVEPTAEESVEPHAVVEPQAVEEIVEEIRIEEQPEAIVETQPETEIAVDIVEETVVEEIQAQAEEPSDVIEETPVVQTDIVAEVASSVETEPTTMVEQMPCEPSEEAPVVEMAEEIPVDSQQEPMVEEFVEQTEPVLEESVEQLEPVAEEPIEPAEPITVESAEQTEPVMEEFVEPAEPITV
ncbi:MAG: S1 RNA-binding domain-containing protein, partial [Candidatus Omnitrophota bacterium]